MSPQAQRIAIAEFHNPGMRAAGCADYLKDLNAMHEAESFLFDQGHEIIRRWVENLTRGCGNKSFASHPLFLAANAAQRAEAMVRSIGKWDDSK